MDLAGYQALVWSLSGVLLAFFAGFAIIYTYIRHKRQQDKIHFDQEEFITARRQVSTVRIGWSFFAGALGAWVISSPPAYTGSGYNYGAGGIGLAFYSLSSGLPVIMIAFAGEVIRRKVPHVLSLTDFMGWRYGYVAKTYVVLLCIFNMSIAMLAEFTTIGTLFGVYLGSKAFAITVVVGLLTMAYTAYGGLFISIITDQVQGIAVVLFFTITVIYVAADFRYPLPTPFPGDCCGEFCDENPGGFCLAGTNKVGYSSIFVMPASLFTATVFSEAMWQRAWASTDKKSLVRGSILGCVGIVLVVFFVGFCGILAAWAGLILPTTNFNLYFFATLGALDENNNISKWIGVVVMLLAVAMNMSAVDSLQNGLAAGISSHFLKGRPVAWTRLAVLVINIPLVVLGARPNGLDLKVLELFLLANMICCTSAIPVLAGLVSRLHRLVGGASMVLSCWLSIFLTSVYGVNYYYSQWDTIRLGAAYGCDCLALAPVTPAMTEDEAAAAQTCIDTCAGSDYAPAAKYQSKDFGSAMNYTWMGNGYAWDFFLIPLSVSLGSLMLCAAANHLLQRCRPQPAVRGFTAPATHPALYPAHEASDGSSDAGKELGGEGQFGAKRTSDDELAAAGQAKVVIEEVTEV